MAGRIGGWALRAEAEFLAGVGAQVRRALRRGEEPESIRARLLRRFRDAPMVRRADVYEQERIVAGVQRTIDAALRPAR